MSRPSLDFSKKATEDFVGLTHAARRQIDKKLDWFLKNFDSFFPIPLTGEFREFFKLRVGDWRIFYKVDWKDQKVTIEYIRHRSRAYKRQK